VANGKAVGQGLRNSPDAWPSLDLGGISLLGARSEWKSPCMPPFLSLARLGNERSFTVLQETARKRSRYGHRDDTMILVAYRHGLRASEVCGLRWGQIDLNSGRLHVRRAKGGSAPSSRTAS
jgi:integrase